MIERKEERRIRRGGKMVEQKGEKRIRRRRKED